MDLVEHHGHDPELGPGTSTSRNWATWVRTTSTAIRPPSWTGSCRPACTHRHRMWCRSASCRSSSGAPCSTLGEPSRSTPRRSPTRSRGCCTRSCSHRATAAPETDDVASTGYRLPSIPLGDAMGLRRPVTARGVGTVQRILLAAAERFRANGYRGTSLNDVAARAGVSHGSVYTYWADRDALFATLAQDAVAAIERPGSTACPAAAHRRFDRPVARRLGVDDRPARQRALRVDSTRWTTRPGSSSPPG